MSPRATAAAPESKPNGFTQVPNDILKANLSHGARLLYSILLSYCWNKDECFPSYDTLMSDMHCHSQALRSYIKELIEHGLITVERRGNGRNNRYILSQRITTTPSETMPAQKPADTPSSSHITDPVLPKSQLEEYIENEYEGK